MVNKYLECIVIISLTFAIYKFINLFIGGY